jgi:hypothetical protein
MRSSVCWCLSSSTSSLPFPATPSSSSSSSSSCCSAPFLPQLLIQNDVGGRNDGSAQGGCHYYHLPLPTNCGFPSLLRAPVKTEHAPVCNGLLSNRRPSSRAYHTHAPTHPTYKTHGPPTHASPVGVASVHTAPGPLP